MSEDVKEHWADTVAEVYKAACELLQEAGHEGDFYPDYSGRGMYGATCPGIVSDVPGTLVGYFVMVAATDLGYDANLDLLIPVRSDNMGLSMIYY